MLRQLTDALKIKNISYKTDVPTATLSTFRIGGNCRVLIMPSCVQELLDAATLCAYSNVPYAIIGRGSNLLFADGQLNSVLIATNALDAVSVQRGALVAQCGCGLPHLAQLCALAGYGDLIFAAGIPGSLGGAIHMNAGAHGGEIGELVEWVEAYHPKKRIIKTYFHEELNFSYRYSAFQIKNEVILRAKLRLSYSIKKDEALSIMRQNIKNRARLQPLSMPNAGSIFRRPSPDIAVGKLLDELGLKGLRRGNAAISEKHAGFIVNLGDATAADVRHLIADVQYLVKEQTGIWLRPEIQEIT